MDGESSYYIYTSDNRIVKIYKCLNEVILKSVNSNRNDKVIITPHGDDVVSLRFVKDSDSKTYVCRCTGQGDSRKLILQPKIERPTDKAFHFKKVVQSDERMYFESCVASGWFIHHANRKVTVDNDKNNMEAKYFKIQKID